MAGVASLPHHALPSILSLCSYSLPEYISLARVCRAWRACVLADDAVFGAMLARCLIESRWYTEHFTVGIIPDGSAVVSVVPYVGPQPDLTVMRPPSFVTVRPHNQFFCRYIDVLTMIYGAPPRSAFLLAILRHARYAH